MRILLLLIGLMFAQFSFAAQELIRIEINNNTSDLVHADVYFFPKSRDFKHLPAHGGLTYTYNLSEDGLTLAKPFVVNFNIRHAESPLPDCTIKRLINASGMLNPLIEININDIDHGLAVCDIGINLREDHE